jgi:hypothetical protein
MIRTSHDCRIRGLKILGFYNLFALIGFKNMTTTTQNIDHPQDKFILTNHLMTYLKYSWTILALIYFLSAIVAELIDVDSLGFESTSVWGQAYILTSISMGLLRALIQVSTFAICFYWLSGRQHAYDLFRVLVIMGVLANVILLPISFCAIFELGTLYWTLVLVWLLGACFLQVSLLVKVTQRSRLRVLLHWFAWMLLLYYVEVFFEDIALEQTLLTFFS